MIEGNTIILRAPEFEDIPVIYRWENDPGLLAYSRGKVPVSAFAIEQYIINQVQDPFAAGQLRFMAVEKAHRRVAGHIDLFEIDAMARRAGVGILVEQEFRGSGYATEMLGLIAQWCRSTLELHQLWCAVSSTNRKSISLFSKAGFVKTGKRIHWTRDEGAWVDEVFMQKIL